MNFAVIGTGWICDEYIKGALDSGLWTFKGVYSRNYDTGLAFSNKYGCDKVFLSLEELAASDEIDAVYVGSPNVLHFEHSKLLLNAKKHVICEKPLVSYSWQAMDLYESAKENGVVFLEAIMFMHLPQRKLLEEAITKIGDISMATFDFCQRSSKLDAYLKGETLPNIFNPDMHTGSLMDLGVYCIYPALYLFGEPDSFSADSLRMKTGVDGAGIVTFNYPDKKVCLRYSKLGEASSHSDIQGTGGTIHVESISRLANIDITYNDKSKEFVYGDDEKYILMGHESKSFYEFINNPDEEFYETCVELSLLVCEYLQKLREEMGSPF